MTTPVSPSVPPGRWTSLWVVAGLSFLAQLWLCQFFSFGQNVPIAIDINPSNLWRFAYTFPPSGTYTVLNWLGQADLPHPLNPLTLASNLPAWLFFTLYPPLIATLALLAMAAFLRELECPRPAAIFGGLIFAWQGDILSFVFPGHFAYMGSWPFYAIGAWGALKAMRTRFWAYAVISGACCGMMVQLEQDRGGIASLLIASIFLAPTVVRIIQGKLTWESAGELSRLGLCVIVAFMVTLGSLLTLFQTNIVGVQMAGSTNRNQLYNFVTQYSIGPSETVTYLVPGLFGWHTNSLEGPYWGEVGETPDWSKSRQGARTMNLAISTIGTVASVLALVGIALLFPGGLMGPGSLTRRQLFVGRTFLVIGGICLVLAWGWHTPLYRPLFNFLPLMDKWRNPLKWLEITNFALVTLSAFGMQHLLTSLAADAKIVRQRLTWATGIILVLLLGGWIASYPYASFILPIKLQAERVDPGMAANIMATLHTSLLFATMLVALMAAVSYGLWRPGWLRQFNSPNPWLDRLWKRILQPDALPLTLTCSMCVLSVLQLGWVTTKFVLPVNLAAIAASNPLMEAIAHEGPEVRVSAAAEDPLLRDLMLHQFNDPRISCLDISAASRIPDDINALFGALYEKSRARLWFLAGVKNVAVPQQFLDEMRKEPTVSANVDHAEGYMLQPTGSPDIPSHALVGMKDYLSKVTLVHRAETLPTRKAVLEKLKDPAWNPRESILLSEDDPDKPEGPDLINQPSTSYQGPDKVELLSYTPTEIKIEVKTATKGYVLINDQYDPDWKEEASWHEVPVLRADFLLRAIQVEAGESTVILRYQPAYHFGRHEISANLVNLFSDLVMVGAWVVAGLAIWRRSQEA